MQELTPIEAAHYNGVREQYPQLELPELTGKERVEYRPAGEDARYGHVDGFSLNEVNEIIILVKFPRMNGPRPLYTDDMYTYRTLHPSNLRLVT